MNADMVVGWGVLALAAAMVLSTFVLSVVFLVRTKCCGLCDRYERNTDEDEAQRLLEIGREEERVLFASSEAALYNSSLADFILGDLGERSTITQFYLTIWGLDSDRRPRSQSAPHAIATTGASSPAASVFSYGSVSPSSTGHLLPVPQ